MDTCKDGEAIPGRVHWRMTQPQEVARLLWERRAAPQEREAEEVSKDSPWRP